MKELIYKGCKQFRACDATVATYGVAKDGIEYEEMEILWSWSTPEVLKIGSTYLLLEDTRKSRSTWKQIYKYTGKRKDDWISGEKSTLENVEFHWGKLPKPAKFY